MMNATGETWDRNEVEAQFRRVMNYATDEAWARGAEEEAMAAMYDVLDGAARHGDTHGPDRIGSDSA
jgi:hypothetical protein